MNVLMCGQNYHVTGGSDMVLLDEMQLLKERGHNVVPFCAASPKNIPNEWSGFFPTAAAFENPGVMDVFRYVYSSKAKSNISRLIKDFRPDVAHLHIYYGKLTGSILKPLKDSGIPIVQTLHEYKVVCPTYLLTSHGQFCEACSGFKFINAVGKRCNRGSFLRSAISAVESYVSLGLGAVDQVDKFIAVSHFLRKQVVKMGVPEHKVVTVHNFVDAERFPRSLSGPGGYFLFYGRLEKNKGVWPLLEAFKKFNSLKLFVVGEGGEGAAMRSYCSSHPVLSQNVSFLGFMEKADLIPIIQGALCTIVPSIWNETFGLTVAESLACGKPVIASRIGGIPEVVEEGEDAILVEPGDIEGLANAIEQLASNPILATEMGGRGRENVCRKFSRERHYDSLYSVYRNLVS